MSDSQQSPSQLASQGQPAPPALEPQGAGSRQRRVRPHYEGDPTLFRVMRRPKWIVALLLALVVAGVFAWLGQWQLENAIRIEHEHAVDSEAVRPLGEITAPGEAVRDGAAGMVVEVSGRFAPGDFGVVEQRSNGDRVGAWVIGHLVTADALSGHLAVAIGWAPDAAAASIALDRLEAQLSGDRLSFEGRYMPGDGAVSPGRGGDPSRLLSMSPAQLVNLWQPFEGRAFAGYLVMHEGSAIPLANAGLEAIDSVPPLPPETVNWVSLFYALEWIVFAGFAVFFWYRLVRDDWERAHELQQLRAAEAAAGGAAGDGADDEDGAA